ncbi:MAG: hypothetical protein WC775_04760 [Patescibacteria group bacterium]
MSAEGLQLSRGQVAVKERGHNPTSGELLNRARQGMLAAVDRFLTYDWQGANLQPAVVEVLSDPSNRAALRRIVAEAQPTLLNRVKDNLFGIAGQPSSRLQEAAWETNRELQLQYHQNHLANLIFQVLDKAADRFPLSLRATLVVLSFVIAMGMAGGCTSASTSAAPIEPTPIAGSMSPGDVDVKINPNQTETYETSRQDAVGNLVDIGSILAIDTGADKDPKKIAAVSFATAVTKDASGRETGRQPVLAMKVPQDGAPGNFKVVSGPFGETLGVVDNVLKVSFVTQRVKDDGSENAGLWNKHAGETALSFTVNSTTLPKEYQRPSGMSDQAYHDFLIGKFLKSDDLMGVLNRAEMVGEIEVKNLLDGRSASVPAKKGKTLGDLLADLFTTKVAYAAGSEQAPNPTALPSLTPTIDAVNASPTAVATKTATPAPTKTATKDATATQEVVTSEQLFKYLEQAAKFSDRGELVSESGEYTIRYSNSLLDRSNVQNLELLDQAVLDFSLDQMIKHVYTVAGKPVGADVKLSGVQPSSEGGGFMGDGLITGTLKTIDQFVVTNQEFAQLDALFDSTNSSLFARVFTMDQGATRKDGLALTFFHNGRLVMVTRGIRLEAKVSTPSKGYSIAYNILRDGPSSSFAALGGAVAIGEGKFGDGKGSISVNVDPVWNKFGCSTANSFCRTATTLPTVDIISQ